MKKYIQVLTTTDKKEEAEKIARALLDGKAAACIQILPPMESVYRWKNKVETSREWLCLIKSREDCYEKIERIIRENHSYEIPEIIAFPIISGSREYLAWLDQEVETT